MSLLVQRLRERKLVQWALAYLAGAFVVLQLLDLAAQPFAWPDLVLRAAWVILAVGFLATLVLAWYHGERGQQRVGGIELLMLAALFAIAGTGVALVAARGKNPAAADPTAAGAGAASAAQASVVVLPFADLSPQRDQEYFSDGLTEEILNALVRIPELRVPARTTSFAFKGKPLPIREIAQQLGVAHVLEGSVRKDGNRLRITTQLIDARTDTHLWSESYDRDLTDVFAVQEEIARAVTAALKVRLTGGPGSSASAGGDTRIVTAGTSDPEAYELYLRGLHAWNRRTSASLRQAAAHFEQSVRRDTAFARGWAGLALTYALIPEYNDTLPTNWVPAIRHAAGRALALDSSLAEAHTALAYMHGLEWSMAASTREYRRALELNPAYATAHQWFASHLTGMGQADEALRQIQRARELDPLSFIINANLGDQLFYARRTAEAVAQYERALELNPEGNLDYQAQYGLVLWFAGRANDALAQASAMLPRLDEMPMFGRTAVTYVLARSNRVAEARAIARRYDQLARQRYVSPYSRAYMQVGLGEHERALVLLEEAVRVKDPQLSYGVNDPVFDPIRSDPRYTRMLADLRSR